MKYFKSYITQFFYNAIWGCVRQSHGHQHSLAELVFHIIVCPFISTELQDMA